MSYRLLSHVKRVHPPLGVDRPVHCYTCAAILIVQQHKIQDSVELPEGV